jgi:UDP-2,3-diacylglucosamine hydrolase
LTNKKTYFASDFHLGVPTYQATREREGRIVKWLDEVSADAERIYLVGDVFDFWFEYKTVVPKGNVRLLGKLAELVDKGIIIEFFTGNHDMWVFNYFEEELGIKTHRDSITINLHGKQFFIGHGDGLGPGDHGYKFIKKVFASKVCQWLFARLHPNLGVGLANFWSRKSRIATGTTEDEYLGDDKEWLVHYCNDILKTQSIDFFVFGHRHLPIEKQLNNSLYINLGDWIKYNTYAVFDGNSLSLKKFEQ